MQCAEEAARRTTWPSAASAIRAYSFSGSTAMQLVPLINSQRTVGDVRYCNLTEGNPTDLWLRFQ